MSALEKEWDETPSACGCGEPHAHEPQHDACGCGEHHAHEHEHDACGCGDHHAHEHQHDACGCGEHHEAAGVESQRYLLDGLTCAHCAGVIENEIQGWDDVESANLNLMKMTLELKTATAAPEMLNRVTECVERIEKGVTVSAIEKKKPVSTAAQRYLLDGLTCAHCAGVIENEVQGWADVKSANLNLMKMTLEVDTDTAPDAMLARVTECVERVEKGVVVSAIVKAAPSNANNHRYILEGLTCAHCAGVIEDTIRQWDDVDNVILDLMHTSLEIQSKTAEDALFARVTDCVNKIEKGVEVKQVVADKSAPKTHKSAGTWELIRENKDEWQRFAIGLALFAFGMALDGGVGVVALLIAYLGVGLPILGQALKAAKGGFVFNEQMLMAVASIGAIAVGEYAEGVAVMLFYTLGELLQDLAVARSKRSISSLLDLRPDVVRMQAADGSWQEVDPEAVGVGALIQIQPGERIALDGVVESGTSSLDTSAVTGESRPFDVAVGDEVQSGSVNNDGVLVMRVTKLASESTLSRILALVEDASARKAPTEKFISKFARYYTPVVVGLAATVAILPPLVLGGDWSTWIYRGLVFLVVSCPCALVISVPLTYFAGIGGASRAHILVKGSQYLETLAGIKQVAFDKTGTLTSGRFTLTEVQATAEADRDEIIALAAALEQYATHPLAKAIVEANGKQTLRQVADYRNLAGLGITAEIDGKQYAIGNRRLMEQVGVDMSGITLPVGTTVLLAEGARLLGVLHLEDLAKEGVKEAIADLHKLGVENTAILSGDTPEVAQHTADLLGVREVHGGLLPGDKITCVEDMMQKGGSLGFVGDGVNDAPVLARADVGIAMGGVGSDAAIEAADIVLMSDHPRDVVRAIKIARKTRFIAWENVVGALTFKGILLILATLGLANMWMAVFADVGVAIICIINALRMLAKVK